MNFLASNYERMNQGVRQLYLGAVDLTPKAPESVSLYTCFAWLWAINELLHRLRFPSDSLMQWVVLVAVAAVLWRPRSALGLLALAVTAAVDYLLSLPQISNFLTLIFFANITLILSIAAHGWKALPGLTVSTALPPVRPLLLFTVCGVYAFSVLHKLNTAFMDPELSYAVIWLEAMKTESYPWPLAWLNTVIPETGNSSGLFIIYWTLFIESLIPLLLIFRRTRVAGIGLDFVFHIIMAYRMYPPSTNFPAAMMALLILGMPSNTSVFLGLTARRILAWQPIAHIWRYRRLIGLAVTVLVLFLMKGSTNDEIHWLRELLRGGYWHLCVLIYGTLFVSYCVWSMRSSPIKDTSFQWRDINRAWMWALVVIFCANAMFPHLGLKSRASMEVFSNLDTFGGRSNHLFIPASFQYFDYLREVVTIEEARPGTVLAHAARVRWIVPYLELERLALQYPDEPLTYSRHGEKIVLPRLGDILEPDGPRHHWLARKLLATHPVPTEEWDRLHRTPAKSHIHEIPSRLE